MVYRKQQKRNKHVRGQVAVPAVVRVRLPKGREVIGLIESRLGGSKLLVKCLDGKTRVCRIPGRLRRRLWVREGDYVIVEPWEYGGDNKGDIVYSYRSTQVNWLKRKGYIEEEKVSLDEF